MYRCEDCRRSYMTVGCQSCPKTLCDPCYDRHELRGCSVPVILRGGRMPRQARIRILQALEWAD